MIERMSKEEKLIERPKVRFCQPPEANSFEKCEMPESTNSVAVLQGTLNNKPRIESIVTVDNSSKFEYKNGKLVSSAKGNIENRGTQNSSESMRNAALSSETNIHRSPLSLRNDQTIAKSQKPSVCENDCEKGSSDVVSRSTKGLIASKAPSDKSSVRNVPCSKSTAQNNESNKNSSRADPCGSGTGAQAKTGAIPKPKTSVSKIASRHVVSKGVPLAGEKLLTKSTRGSNEAVALPKNTVCRNNVSQTNRQKEKTGKKSSLCFGRGITSSAKTVSSGLKTSKPGNKTWKTRSKSSPVKKTILRDVNACKTNVYVGPGVARYYPQTFKGPIVKEGTHIRPDIVSGEKLGRPEYNSIICTIEELKRVQSEKFVTDVEHLPLVYKNLVNEKISAALDFPPDEAIYKNLVDLSVSENQLPSRLIRSKDPEPRHRDIVPQLSDFFTPSYSEEYCSAVQIRPSSPEISSNWSAFVISDKIFGWKHDMDQYC